MNEEDVNLDFASTEVDMQVAGRKPLTAEALAAKIVGKTAYGDFGAMFKYVMAVDSDGGLEGKNNAGAHTFGRWEIDLETGEMTVEWTSGWVTSTTRAYGVDGHLKLYETATGRWATTLHRFIDGTVRPLTL